MKAYSTDLRERVVRAVDEGKSRDEISEMLGVSRSTIKRYLKQRKEEGDLVPKAIPGRPAKKRDAVCADLLPQLEANPSATLDGLGPKKWRNETWMLGLVYDKHVFRQMSLFIGHRTHIL